MAQVTPLLAPFVDGPDSGPGGEAQRRGDARSNIFVVAALASGEGSGPVRIRNMSRSGALIEGAVIPPERSPMRLSRGSLSVAGKVVWLRGKRAGVRFDSCVAVADWLPSGNRSSGQQRVDEIVYAYKSGAPAAHSVPVGAPANGPCPSGLADQLLELRRALSAVAEELANDAAVAEGHLGALQKLDMTAQKLETLARRLP